MKTYKTIQPEPKDVVDKVVCDLCGQDSSEWEDASDIYWINDNEISHRNGTNYPEGGHGERLIEPDICPTCWREKVIPALFAIGVPIKYEDWEW